MKELMENIDKAFYQYPKDLNSFYGDNEDLIDVLEVALRRGYPLRQEMESLQDLFDEFNGFIKFQSEYNESIYDYLI